MKHMTLSFKMKGGIISDHFLMLWFQKDSLDTVGFRTFRTFRGGVRESEVTFGVLNVPREEGSHWFRTSSYHFLSASLKQISYFFIDLNTI